MVQYPALMKIAWSPLARKEKEIIQGIELHLVKAQEAVDYLVKLVKDGSEIKTVENIIRTETEADEIHRQLSLKIAEGAFFGGIREDILNLMEQIDNIADSAKDAARFIHMRGQMGDEAKAFLSSNNMSLFMEELRGSVNSLGELIKSLEISKKEALLRVHRVEENEERADTLKDALLRELFDKSGRMDPLTVIQLRDFIFSADNIADSAEDASDVILVMIAKGYG
jgi:predicted phosphate transport protein (TIGR00153 family)